MYNQNIKDMKNKSDEVIEKLKDELKNIHTGRASSALVENIDVVYYGQKSVLKQMASITVPQSNQIVITPWDNNSLGDIENSIRNSDLGFNPINDGKNIRINLPPLTEERRNEFATLVTKMSEEARIAIRNLREEVWKEVKNMEKNGDLTEDDRYQAEEEINKIVKDYNNDIEKITDRKISDLKTV
jgi:ribosome recycling factor